MKIILVNYRYFITGGPERYLFNIKELLEREGHTVIPFSVRHKANLPCSYEKYFASPIGKGDITFFSESDKTNLRDIGKFFSRMFFSFEVRRKFRRLVSDTKPDLVYVLHYQNKLSPSFIGTAKRRNLPVVQRVSDFGHICANQLFYNFRLDSVCERCLEGSKLNAVIYRCVYSSALYSLIKVSALKFHELLRITSRIDAFVIPSRFTYSKLAAFGIPEHKLNHIPSFFNDMMNRESPCNREVSYGDFALFVGRIEKEKGMMTLARAFEGTDMNLKIIGFSGTGYDVKLKEYLSDKSHNIEFCGKLPFNVICGYLTECAFTICPTECYDNFPNTVIESFAFRKAVICTNIGSLKEMVEDNVSGLMYEPQDHLTLRKHCLRLFAGKEESIKMGLAGRKKIDCEFTESDHYNRLINLFEKLISAKN